jgi:hypothetical protein
VTPALLGGDVPVAGFPTPPPSDSYSTEVLASDAEMSWRLDQLADAAHESTYQSMGDYLDFAELDAASDRDQDGRDFGGRKKRKLEEMIDGEEDSGGLSKKHN